MILYNTTDNKVIGKPYKGTYTDNWPKGILNEGIIEIDVIDTIAPPFDHTIERLINDGYIVENEQYVRKWRVIPLTEYELAVREWDHQLEFAKRIVAPIDLGEQEPGVKAHFDLHKLPIIVKGTTVYMYCNVVLDRHLEKLTLYSITPEDRPTILNPIENVV